MITEIGELDRRITIQRLSETGRDPYNEPITEWVDVAQLFAKVAEQTGREYRAAMARVAERRVVFTIRYMPGLTVTDRIQWEGDTFDIHSIRELGRRDKLELLAKGEG